MHAIDDIISYLSEFILWLINSYGYSGILWAMAIESACIPLPSEVIMTFSGFLASKGTFSITGVTFAGAFGNLIGSWFAYFVGRFGGRRLFEKHGKLFFVSQTELEKADDWFLKYGEITVFITRMLPLIRTFISLPAGVSKMNLFKFSVYSFIGSIPWCFALAYFGKGLGSHWRELGPYFHRFDFLVLVCLVLFLIWLRWSNGQKKIKAPND